MKKGKKLNLVITNISKLSFNSYKNLHWRKQKEFKDLLRQKVSFQTDGLQLKGGYDIHFSFYFQGRKLDTINAFHYAKIIEDVLFKQDTLNRKICLNVFKLPKHLDENYVEIELVRI